MGLVLRIHRTEVTDPLGNASTFGYDSLNRLISTADALGNQSRTDYDDAGHVVKRTDPAGNATSYSYDAAGRQTTTLDAAGGQIIFGYDKVGNRTKITNARGNVTQSTFDGLNRLLTVTDPLGNVTTNQYDAVGNLTKVTDGNGNSRTYTFDANRRQTGVTYSTGGTLQFTYDAAGNRTGMVDLIGQSTYTYDALNRLQSYRSPAGATLGFSYDAASGRTALQYPGAKSVQYTYDANHRISKVTDWNGLQISYSYDAAGRLQSVSYSNGLSSQYTYDAAGQNVSIVHRNNAGVIYSEATTWSATGNPVSSDISGLTSPGLASENTAYAYNAADQLTMSTYGASIHDRNGNLVSQPGFGGTTVFTYDLNNRATAIIGPPLNASMKYFGDGKLAELDAAGVSHRFLVDPAAAGNCVLAELDQSGAMQTAYVYGPTGMVSQISGGQTYGYLHNLQGSTVALADSTGATRNSYRYDPFGQRLSSSTELVANLFGFLGAFSVPSVDKYSITAHRLYDALQGRFTGLDPLAGPLAVQLSGYIYSRQAPMRLIDPSGLWPTLAQVGSAFGQALSEVPSFALCSITGFEAEGACRKQGFSESWITAGQFTTGVVASAVGVGVVAEVVQTGTELTTAAIAASRGDYTLSQAAGLVVSVGSDLTLGKLGINDALEKAGESALGSVVGNASASAIEQAIAQTSSSAASGLAGLTTVTGSSPRGGK
jgi:RHS repeat-associated protein